MGNKKEPVSIFSGVNTQNNLQVLKQLREFRKSGQPEQIPELIKFFHKTDNEEIKNNIIQILNDLKSKRVIPVLIDEITLPSNKNIQNILVSSCWQSGLDYSNYFDFFINLMQSCNYITAIETFTVIEEMNITNSDNEIDKSIQFLKKNLPDFEPDKQFLVRELIHILEHKKMAG